MKRKALSLAAFALGATLLPSAAGATIISTAFTVFDSSGRVVGRYLQVQCDNGQVISQNVDTENPCPVGQYATCAQQMAQRCPEAPPPGGGGSGGIDLDDIDSYQNFFSASYEPWGACMDPFPNTRGHWTFDESGTVSEDMVGSSDAQLKNGASSVPAVVGDGVHFDGSNDYAEIPDASVLDIGTGDFSIQAWVRTTQSSGVRVILDKREIGYRGYHLYTYNGRLGLQLADGGYSNYNTSVSIADGAWHHVAVTVDRNNTQGITWYIDGIERQRHNPTGRQGSLSNARPLRLSSRSYQTSGFWQGDLDELSIVGRALSRTEIEDIYAAEWSGMCW